MGLPRLFLITTRKKTFVELQKILKAEFELIHFISGKEALAEVRKKHPDGIVMDLGMEDMPPFYFIDKIRNNPLTRNLAFVIISRESSQTFVEQSVRSGVSHYIGVPYEANVLREKLRLAFIPNTKINEAYFNMPIELNAKILSHGRISYITADSIHFETHLKLEPEAMIHFMSPLSTELKKVSLQVKVKKRTSDVYYNYPFAVDAEWVDEKIKKEIRSWIIGNKHLNSPKKIKILVCHPKDELQETYLKNTKQAYYSVRFDQSLEGALENLPYMRPRCFVTTAEEWQKAPPKIRAGLLKIFKDLNITWVHCGNLATDEDVRPQPHISPDQIELTPKLIEQLLPPEKPDPHQLFFSKDLEDSRLKLFFYGKTTRVGEMGMRLLLEHEVEPPCNLQLDLKEFSKFDLRNPHLRAWKAISPISKSEIKDEKYLYAVETQFLGINDNQGQGMRQWLREIELKEKHEENAAVPPKIGEEKPEENPEEIKDTEEK